MKYGLDTELKFGKYAGMEIWEVLNTDWTYIKWCLENINDFQLDNEAFESYERKKRWKQS